VHVARRPGSHSQPSGRPNTSRGVVIFQLSPAESMLGIRNATSAVILANCGCSTMKLVPEPLACPFGVAVAIPAQIKTGVMPRPHPPPGSVAPITAKCAKRVRQLPTPPPPFLPFPPSFLLLSRSSLDSCEGPPGSVLYRGAGCRWFGGDAVIYESPSEVSYGDCRFADVRTARTARKAWTSGPLRSSHPGREVQHGRTW